MGKLYNVVISPGIDFYLTQDDVLYLKERGQQWAIGAYNAVGKVPTSNGVFTPSQEELPRHDEILLEMVESTEKMKRLIIEELEVKVWPPKYFILNTQPMGGEEVFEPCTVPWKTVYYPEKYNSLEAWTLEEQLIAKINAIAP